MLSVVPGVGLREFLFNGVFSGASATQEAIYSETKIREAVCDFLNGQNTSVVCYGQTASGKTFTMFGPPELTAFNTSKSYAGIAPRACQEVFKYLEQQA